MQRSRLPQAGQSRSGAWMLPVERSTPALINAALQLVQFADVCAAPLEDQVIEVLRSPAEVGSSIAKALRAVGADVRYRAPLTRVLAARDNKEVTPLRLRQAIAACVRTLVALDSRFDKAVR